MQVLDSFDEFFAGAGLIEGSEGSPHLVPGKASAADDVFHVLQLSSRKTEFIMTCGMKQAGFLRHQSANSKQQHRYAAGKRLISRERTRFRQHQIRSGDESLDVLNEAESSCSRVTERFDALPHEIISAADHENVGVA